MPLLALFNHVDNIFEQANASASFSEGLLFLLVNADIGAGLHVPELGALEEGIVSEVEQDVVGEGHAGTDRGNEGMGRDNGI